MSDLEQREDLAEAMVPVACELACAVRDDPDLVSKILRKHRDNLNALVVVLAAMVPDDRTTQQLLGWVDWQVEVERVRAAGVSPAAAETIRRERRARGLRPEAAA